MKVAAVIPTRGDVDITPVVESLIFDEVYVWDNSKRPDRGAYARYMAALLVTAPVIYTQDDDCIVPAEDQERLVAAYQPGVLTALMPPSRTDYTDTVLVGWGSIWDSHLPYVAFSRWLEAGHVLDEDFRVVGADFVFPLLTPHARLDGEHKDMPWADAPNRTWADPRNRELKAGFISKARALGGK